MTDKINKSECCSLKLKMTGILVFFLTMIIFTGCSTQSTSQNNTYPKSAYKAGKEGESGNWGIRVLDANETNIIQSGDSSYKVTTNEKFIVITLEMKNITGRALSYTAREFMIMNKNTKTEYDINNPAFNAMAAANGREKVYKENTNFLGVKDEVGPGIIKQTYIIFEVPKNTRASDYMLINTNGDGEPTGFYLK